MNISNFISNIFIKTNSDRISLDTCCFVEGYGILGDSKGGTPFKEVVIYIKPNTTEEDFNGLCISKFKPNIILDKININKLKVNDSLIIGDAILKINKIGKDCYRDCSLINSNKSCSLKSNVIFTSVIKDGNFKINKKDN